MPTFAKRTFSASTNGAQILVAGTAIGSSTLIHTSIAGDIDEVWIYAVNLSASAVNLSILWTGTAAANEIRMAVPASNGLYLIVPGLIISGGLSVRAYAGTANVVALHGWVNRITN